MKKPKKEKNDGVQSLITKYEKQYEEMIVMDDYDGGQKESLRVIIEELKKMKTC